MSASLRNGFSLCLTKGAIEHSFFLSAKEVPSELAFLITLAHVRL